ncbi:glycosyltransferase family 4 protein [Enterocloster clostridioformis]|uniref:glycosyltransferase family 4 protein n=1 Tax=Enterocloster clostridioformis TaxID=1531 RepID=UPI000482557D|nr:glycosyltransferase family 4 protein [Enterocloster clostridioformis]
MRILSITAQKPHSTGSGVYLTGLIKGFATLGHEQAVVAGVYKEDEIHFPEGTRVYPVYYRTESLPFPIAGMSDEMPYESTIYSQMTEDMVDAFRQAFLEKTREAVECFRPDLILCHHLYLLTALVREAFPQYKTAAICHGTGLRQIKKNSLERDYILAHIKELHKVFCLHREQREEISRVYGVPGERLEVIGSGFDDSIFRYMPVKKEDGVKRLIYAGKLSEKKGVMSLLRSLVCLEQLQRQWEQGEMQQRLETGQPPEPVKIEVWLAGGYGNQLEYETIKKLAEQSPYPVKFLGRLDQPQLAKRMNQADVFVLPSFYEGLPLVVIEALACGLQVVCTDLPGVRPWLEENIGTCPVKFVPLPAIMNADEPVEQELPQFERRLAEAIGGSLGIDGSSLGTDGGVLETDGGVLETDGGVLETDGRALETDGMSLGTVGREYMTAAGPSLASPLPDMSRIWAGISKKILESCNFV